MQAEEAERRNYRSSKKRDLFHPIGYLLKKKTTILTDCNYLIVLMLITT
jgi:hypothetical protein